MESIKLYSDRVWIGEQDKDPDILVLRILISTFEPNLNGVLINRDTIDSWISTIITKPLVAKIAYKTDIYGKNKIADFTGHNVSVETFIDESGIEQERLVFDTQAFGTIVSANIENVDGKDGIVVVAHVWRRYYTATEIIERRIKQGNLHTSWEISVLDYEKKIIDGKVIKIINKGIFSADTMLGNAVPPAFPTARVLDVASDESDSELSNALIQDSMLINENVQGNEVQHMNDEEKIIESSEKEYELSDTDAINLENTTVSEISEDGGEKKEEIAELTMRDVRWRLEEAIYKFTDKYLDIVFIFPESHKAWVHDWQDKETDMYELTYVVENDQVSVSDMIQVTLIVELRNINSSFDEKNAALVDANAKINELSAQIESLSVYKEAAEKAEREAAEAKRISDVAELRAYTESASIFTKEELASTEIEEMISTLKATEIKALIADRIVAKSRKTKPEVATVKQPKERVDINTVPDTNLATAFREYIHGKK